MFSPFYYKLNIADKISNSVGHERNFSFKFRGAQC